MKYTFLSYTILNLPQYDPGHSIMYYALIAAVLNETPLSVTQSDNIVMTAGKFQFINKYSPLELIKVN